MPPVAKRILLSMLAGLILGAAVSEISHFLLKDTARPPKEVDIIIPQGTAQQVARGEQPPSIPKDMIFVVGDILVVKNQDTSDHRLGPLWIPANSSAQLSLDQEESLAYECSFQPGNYFGIDVKEPLTLGTRVYGIFYAGLPMGILIAVYSFVIPAKKKANAAA